MNTHRSYRAQSKTAGLRKWFIETMMGSTSHIDSRRLLCEQLERRYALHGMGWLEVPQDRYEYSDTVVVDDFSTSARFSEFREWEGEFQTSGQPRPMILDLFATGDSSIFDGLNADAFDEVCNHPHGLDGEGEAPKSRTMNDRGFIDFWKLTSKPEPKIDSLQPDSNSTKTEVPAMAIVKESLSNLESAGNNLLAQNHPPAAQSAGATTTNATSGAVNSVGHVVSPAAALLTASARFGGAESNSVVSMNSGTRSTSTSPTIPAASLRSATPSLTSSKADVSASVAQATVVSRVSPSAGNISLADSVNSTKERSTSLANTWQRNVSAVTENSKSKIDGETEGLLSELRAVIEKLANDRAGDKADFNAGRQHNSSLTNRASGEFFGSERRAKLFDDGMLELGVSHERLPSNAESMESIDQATSELQHRSQLIASLELNREFELAGQSVRIFKSVIDPTTQVQEASLAAEDVGSWHDQFGKSAGLSASSGDAEAPIWQRSILPLSFMAVGALLMRSRQKYRALQSRK